jgi:hypothetical protein
MSVRDIREHRQNSTNKFNVSVLKCLNKEEEQIASLKFLRLLGKHLKDPSPIIAEGLTSSDQMKEIYNKINLGNVALQEEN